MIRYIKEKFEIGDHISIYSCEREIRGVIEIIDDNFIVLRSEDDNIIGIKIDSITGFSSKPIEITPRDLKWEKDTNKYQRQGGRNAWRRGKLSTPPYSEPYKSDALLEQEKEVYHEISSIKEEIKSIVETFIQDDPSTADILIPPMGVIVELRNTFQFGFIDDNLEGVRYFFNKNDIIDPNLKNVEGEMIEVVYQKGKNHKGPAAKNIHKSDTIGGLLQLMITHLDFGSYSDAFAIMENIKVSNDGNYYLDKISLLMGEILEKAKSIGYEVNKGKNSLYSEARRRLQNKDYDSALDIYHECLNLGFRKENCIKDILQIYVTTYAQKQSEYERNIIKEKALDFLNEHIDSLPDEQSTYFTIENAYFALGEYEKHIEVAEEIVAECGRNGELPQYVFYLNKLAQSYFRIGDFEKALDAVHQGLDIEPENQHLIKTMKSIIDAQDNGDDTFFMS
ncbi:tetratricopeptide repeat protein [Porphyromonadaceae bacterium W3.11]|nr:tetratricopeptide repeat protein [Porphyromonadaceae bacterium W3.11]